MGWLPCADETSQQPKTRKQMNTQTTLETKTKAEFARSAKSNGVNLVGAPWNMSLADIVSLINEQGERIIANTTGKRERVTGSACHLKREKFDGGVSHLRMGKEDTVYSYGQFWLIRGEHDNGSNNTVVYLS